MKNTNCQESPVSIRAEISGYRHRSITCLDWLQMDSRGTIQISDNYPVKDTYKSTLVFKKLYEIHNHNYYVASLVSQPIASFLPRDLHLVKMLNKELYYYRPCFRLNTIIHEIGLIPLQPCRIDLAIDFNYFAYGFHPGTLISNFFNNKFLKVGMTKYIINGNQEKFNKTHYLKFAKKDCNVDVYLYNKSKELREVKNKPWIVETWKRAGLDISKDVWRLEFSLHNPRFIVRDNKTGITARFNWLMLDNKEYLNNVINSLINKYFDFRRNTYIKDRKAMPKVQLFMGINDTTITWDRSSSIESDKADKLFLKKLGLLNDEVRDIYTDIEKNTVSVINYFKISRGL